MSERACEGGVTVAQRLGGEHMRKCLECSVSIRCDMVDHPFWGFAASCLERRAKAAKASTQSSGDDLRERVAPKV